MPDTPTVFHDTSASQFEIRGDKGLALLRYAREGPNLDLLHTEVPDALGGHGYAGALAKAALDYARDEGLKVIPSCSFVSTFIRRHPDYASLVATT